MTSESENNQEFQDSDTVFEATLVPHRSLPPIGFVLVMGLLIVISMAIGVGFMLVGAWPVIGFLGIDVLLVYLAFRLSYGAARRREHIRLSADALEIYSRGPGREDRRTSLQPYWARVEVEGSSPRNTRLVIRSRGETVELGAFLAMDEKLAFAGALRDALRHLREPLHCHWR